MAEAINTLTDATLLVIDSDAAVRERAAHCLAPRGYLVEGASGADDALARLAAGAMPELVIIDLQMATADGKPLLQQLRAAYPGLPVIVMSAAGELDDVVLALRLGARDYIEKPLTLPKLLIKAVKHVLAQVALERENQRYREQLEATNLELKENLRMLERDYIAGRQVQRRMMPSGVQTKEGYKVAHHIAPSFFLSGDFVDYNLINQRYLAFYLADVSGHGASSAFVTIWLKHLVGRMVREEGLFGDESSFELGANQMLQRINHELHEARLGHHLTFFVGVIDTVTGQMRYVVAGHLPQPMLLTDKGAEYLQGMGKPVGIFKEVSWTIQSYQLPQRFSLLCFSDGVLEILPPEALEQKEARLLQQVAGCDGTLDSVCSVLAIKDIRDNPDDIAVLAITRGL